jgi:hypothetical protein
LKTNKLKPERAFLPMDITELEKHIIKLHELGGIQVVPYDVVIKYVQKMHEMYVQSVEELTTSFEDVIKAINENED